MAFALVALRSLVALASRASVYVITGTGRLQGFRDLALCAAMSGRINVN